MRRSPFRKFRIVGIFTLLFVLVSTGVYYLIGRSEWSLFDCFYMTVISITTVGYGEILDFSRHPEGRWFSIFVVLWGYLIFVYFVSIMSEILVTGQMVSYFRERRVRKMIGGYENHYIICGFGEMGYHVAKEIYATYNPLVIIDNREDVFQLVAEYLSPKIAVVRGDASDEDVLRQAGIEKAKGMVLTLPEDKDNLFSLVTVRSLNPGLKVATKCVHESNTQKFYKAGAYKVISPAGVGGTRLASELLRPTVTTFIDTMMRDKKRNVRISEIDLSDGMECIGKTLRDSMFRKTVNVLVMAVVTRDENGVEQFVYNPSADLMLNRGDTLIVIGKSEDIARFKKII